MRGSSSLVPSPSFVPTPATGLERPSSHGRAVTTFASGSSLPVPAHACSARHQPEPPNSAHRASSPLFCIAATSIAPWPGQTRSSRHRQPLRRVVSGLRPQHVFYSSRLGGYGPKTMVAPPISRRGTGLCPSLRDVLFRFLRLGSWLALPENARRVRR
ncbi:hypothetical protein VNO77_20166 [Canavalia gladiata]|uniref:Uncharacterized protein n=1 Tax=Canavalia gladiata TaxID=3824 RepID=A0AAN9LNT9_CANGL